MSAAATRNPSSIDSRSISPRPAGSQTTPDGTPYITTKRPSALPIHGPAHVNDPGSATRASPSPSPPSQRDTVHPVARLSPEGGSGI